MCMSDHLSRTFAALADPTRRAILARLSRGEASVTELANPFPMSMPAICKHLKVLEDAGLITRRRNGKWRPCRLAAAPLRQVADWVERHRRFWEKSVDYLKDHLPITRARSNMIMAVNKSRNNVDPGHADKAKSQSRRQPTHALRPATQAKAKVVEVGAYVAAKTAKVAKNVI
jgi:DNA-binding transcriptional ArsR family regulator